jgi:hypothetical protein
VQSSRNKDKERGTRFEDRGRQKQVRGRGITEQKYRAQEREFRKNQTNESIVWDEIGELKNLGEEIGKSPEVLPRAIRGQKN